MKASARLARVRANGLCLRCYQREWRQRKKEEARELQHA